MTGRAEVDHIWMSTSIGTIPASFPSALIFAMKAWGATDLKPWHWLLLLCPGRRAAPQLTLTPRVYPSEPSSSVIQYVTSSTWEASKSARASSCQAQTSRKNPSVFHAAWQKYAKFHEWWKQQWGRLLLAWRAPKWKSGWNGDDLQFSTRDLQISMPDFTPFCLWDNVLASYFRVDWLWPWGQKNHHMSCTRVELFVHCAMRTRHLMHFAPEITVSCEEIVVAKHLQHVVTTCIGRGRILTPVIMSDHRYICLNG